MTTNHRWCDHNNLLRILIRTPKHSIPVYSDCHTTSLLPSLQHKVEHKDYVHKHIDAQFTYYFIRLCSIYRLPILSASSTPIYVQLYPPILYEIPSPWGWWTVNWNLNAVGLIVLNSVTCGELLSFSFGKELVFSTCEIEKFLKYFFFSPM